MVQEKAWCAGLQPSEFWDLNFATLVRYIKAKASYDITRDLSLSWHTANFGRAKKMPDLGFIIRGATRGDPYKRTPEEAAQMEMEMRDRLRALGTKANGSG